MEEKKIKNAPTKEKELSFDDLKKVVDQLSHERDFYKGKAEEFHQELQKANLFNEFKRADYLFKTLEFSPYFSNDFINSCAKELEDFLKVSEPTMEEVKESE